MVQGGELEFKKSQFREYFESIVITAIIALFATTFVIQAFKIPTGSMESNLLIEEIPLFPEHRLFHVFSTPVPRGVTSPRPVTTTLLFTVASSIRIFPPPGKAIYSLRQVALGLQTKRKGRASSATHPPVSGAKFNP